MPGGLVPGDLVPGDPPGDDREHDAAPAAAPDRLTSVSALMGSVSTAYTAAHGHPLDHDGLVAGQVRRRRWSVGVRVAVIASLAVALVTGVVVIRDLARASGTPMPLAQVDPGSVGPAGGPASSPATEVGEGDSGSPSTASPATSSPATALVAVHVVGQVNNPGVVEVAAGSRVVDAITAAGGLTEEADAGAVNLARPVVDGEQVYVPAPGEEVPVAAGPAAPAPGSVPGTVPSVALLDLNSADAAALDTLPGIGPALAGRIIAWREANGGFASVEDLLEVSGIGPAVLAKIRDLVAV